MKKVTIVLRSPFLDRIPSLKNMILFLGKKGIKVKLITTTHPDYPQANLDCPNIHVISSPVRIKKTQPPTVIRLMWNLMKDVALDKSDIYIGADDMGCQLISKLNNKFNLRYWNFLLEYPDIENEGIVQLLRYAEKIITHDKWHSDFLNKTCNTRNEQYLYLPNSTFTEECHEKTDYLAKRVNLPSDSVVLLHSGGLGKWFMCEELALASNHLAPNQYVVFHTSHNVTKDKYFKRINDSMNRENLPVRFSLKPVTDQELDTLVASATIGLAFYSIDVLGYRAEYMGVAAGKIGNSLKCGVPVIATKLPSLSYLEDYECGVLIDSFEELPAAVNQILENYSNYCENAYKCYRELWEPQKYLDAIFTEVMH